MASEKDIETYLREQVKCRGGKAYKFVSPGNDGVPDRLVVMPGGHMCFVELKAPGKKSTPLQQLQQKHLADLNCVVFADVDSREKVDAILAAWKVRL